MNNKYNNGQNYATFMFVVCLKLLDWQAIMPNTSQGLPTKRQTCT